MENTSLITPTSVSNMPQEVKKTDGNKKLILTFILLQVITLAAAGFLGYQNYLLKKSVGVLSTSPTPTASLEPANSVFKYFYMTQEEYRQKLTAFMIDANKDKIDYQVEDSSQLINESVKEYEEMDEFTKWLFSACPSNFLPTSGYASVDKLELPFSVQGSYKLQCTATPFMPRLSNFAINISSVDFGTPIQSSAFFIIGNKACGGDMYGVSASDILERLGGLNTINGVKVEVNSGSMVNNESGQPTGYQTFIYTYKEFPDYLVANFVVLYEKTNDGFKSLDLSQYPNINPQYKKIIDQLSGLSVLVKPI